MATGSSGLPIRYNKDVSTDKTTIASTRSLSNKLRSFTLAATSRSYFFTGNYPPQALLHKCHPTLYLPRGIVRAFQQDNCQGSQVSHSLLQTILD